MFNSQNPYSQTPPTSQGIYQQQQQQQQQQQHDMSAYQGIQRPPAADFNGNYLRQQGSQQSLQDAAAQQHEQPQQIIGGGFTDIPSLNYPATPPSHSNFAIPNQNQMINTPPPTMGALYKHSNNSQSLVQNNIHTSNNHGIIQQPSSSNLQQSYGFSSPSQYSADSEYLQGNAMSRSSSPYQQQQQAVGQQYYNIGSNDPSPVKSIKNNFQPQLQNQNQQYQRQQPIQPIQATQQQQQQQQQQPNIPTQNQMNQTLMQQQQQQQQDSTPNYMYFERRPDLLTKSTQDKAAAVKLKIENFYQSSVKYAIERNERRVELENELASHEWSEERRNRQLASLGKKESQFLRLRRTRLSLEDFHTVKVIGKGAFGEVRLVQKRDTGKIYAMKTLLKSEMYKKDQLAHVKAERDVLAGSDSPWVVSLYYSFQDTQYLYLIMEFLPGGDLMTMLIRWQLFTEDVTRFYMAECILAIETIHKLGFIHRDIKPDNILIDIRGHIKLSDFGLSTGFHKTHDSNYYKKLLQDDENNGDGNNTNNLAKPGSVNPNDDTRRQSNVIDSINLTMSNRQQIQTWRKSRRLMAYSTVGTPDYIAPEIFLYQGYGQECDWWSLGAIMYECLIGWPPFCSETPQETYRKIMNFEQTLQFPDDIHISYEAEDLIRRLLTHADQRLGRHGGADEIKSHPFFRGVDWNTIRQVEAPYIPKLSSITDTRFFPTDELENVPDSPAMAQAAKQREQMMKNGGVNGNATPVKEDLPFIGYTYSRFDYLTRKNAI
ncbi:serine/threonine protein kinase CBK1 NDAI_0F03200 [Naumovozyma dairenensis CBS 421]|uniref:Serine/threonine-protein kinase CBK1 n=1 Tax=Naumovozyma dairenensis (strain ATCC 10597 / BCRC 20456 / CBS 421 / NBRC 0211 / NRRL Y-12639) TaxID=1071378 RepID=G0WCX7_NAUDC|nr:hypothetical protein NDAI_0F03200 [Naumovozyma dairenensis CBS 421]CCD25638.1 hypothetical protein NDAI_0F03200 [Naumovozyma dairenensis CBS 421]